MFPNNNDNNNLPYSQQWGYGGVQGVTAVLSEQVTDKIFQNPARPATWVGTPGWGTRHER